MASQDHVIKIKSSASDYVYHTSKNKKKVDRKIKLKKFDPIVRKHVVFNEVKK